MKILVTVILLVGLIGCGKIEIIQPKEFVVKHKVDFEDLERYFNAICQRELTKEDDPSTSEDESYTPSQVEIQTCINTKIAEFLEAIT